MAADSFTNDRNAASNTGSDAEPIIQRTRQGSEIGGAPGEINETGHAQEVERNFSLLSICSVGIVVGGTWPAFGGSIAVAIS